MDNTNHDLSYDEAKLDYEALLNTAKIALGATLERISEHTSKIRNLCLHLNEDNITGLHLNCHWLKGEANSLAVAGETLATLIGGLSRNTITIVNKGE